MTNSKKKMKKIIVKVFNLKTQSFVWTKKIHVVWNLPNFDLVLLCFISFEYFHSVEFFWTYSWLMQQFMGSWILSLIGEISFLLWQVQCDDEF